MIRKAKAICAAPGREWKRESFHRLWCACQTLLLQQTRFENPETAPIRKELIAAAHADALPWPWPLGCRAPDITDELLH